MEDRGEELRRKDGGEEPSGELDVKVEFESQITEVEAWADTEFEKRGLPVHESSC